MLFIFQKTAFARKCAFWDPRKQLNAFIFNLGAASGAAPLRVADLLSAASARRTSWYSSRCLLRYTDFPYSRRLRVRRRAGPGRVGTAARFVIASIRPVGRPRALYLRAKPAPAPRSFNRGLCPQATGVAVTSPRLPGPQNGFASTRGPSAPTPSGTWVVRSV